MLESAPRRRAFQSWRIQVASCLWLALVMSPVLAEGSSCCPQGVLWSPNTGNCTDGSEIQLSCSHGYYKVNEDDSTDTFDLYEKDNMFRLAVTDNRSNNADLNNSLTLDHPDRYCIAITNETVQPFALVCFRDNLTSWRQHLFGIFCIISSIFLILTISIYLILPELRDTQDKAMMSAIGPLALAFVLMGVQLVSSTAISNDSICVAVAVLMYYAYICSFFWLNIVSFNVWRSVCYHNYKIKSNKLFAVYCAVGWGIPTCFLITAVAAHNIQGDHLSPGFGEISCWFNGTAATWVYFEGPISVLLVCNLIYLGLTCWKLWREYRDFNGDRLNNLRFKCLMYVKLVLVMGITWVFEVLSFASGPRGQIYWIFTDVLNTLQGVIIFVILVATRKRVKKLLAKKRPFGIPFPKSWAAVKDDECDGEILPEEVELSHSN